MRKSISYVSLALFIIVSFIGFSSNAICVSLYENQYLPIKLRVADLLRKMTVEEKVAQCIQVERNYRGPAEVADRLYGSVLSGGGSVPTPNTFESWVKMINDYQTSMAQTRLGIPIIYGIDSVHGFAHTRGSTVFPHNIGLGSTRNPVLIKKIAKITALETSALGINWSFSPCTADPQNIRWGRTYEGFSQDATVNAEYVKAYVEGLQGETQRDYRDKDTISATAKHYALEGWTVNGENQGNTILPENYMTDEKYINDVLIPALAPYKAAVDSGVLAIMPSYNSINGLKMHENHFMLTEILKNRFGFEGFLIGDWNAHEQVNGSPYEQVVNCFNAGLDMFMCGNPNTDTPVYEALLNAVKSGDVSMERLDDAVSRILTVKFKLGLFDNNRYPDGDSIENIGSKEHRDVARQAVRESLVLLKNKNNIISDLKNMKNIFVAGKNADDIGNQSGGWTISWQGSSGEITDGTTILEGIRKNVKEGVNVKYNKEGMGPAGYDIAIVILGETPYAEGEGDAKDASRLKLDATDVACLNNIRKENPSIPIVVILISGRPMLVADYVDDWEALIAAWLPGTEGDGVAEVLFNEDYDFVGKTSFAWPMTFNDIDNNPVLGQKKKMNNLFEMWYGLSK